MNLEIYVKYGFLAFAKSIGKNLSNKYGRKRLDSAKKSAKDAIRTASKRAIQKTAEATGDLVSIKVVDKITSVSKKSLQRSCTQWNCLQKMMMVIVK